MKKWLLAVVLLASYAVWIGTRYKESKVPSSWLSRFQSPLASERQRVEAGIMLGAMMKRPELVVPALLSGLEDENVMIRRTASYVLWENSSRIGPELVIPLRRCLYDPDFLVSQRAAEALARIGPSAKGAIPDLHQAMDRPEIRNRLAVLRCLWSIDRKHLLTAQACLLGLNDSSIEVRLLSSRLLKRAIRTKETIPTVLDVLLNDKDDSVRKQAAELLGWLGTRLALPRIVEIAVRGEDEQRRLALYALSRYRGREAVPELLLLLQHDDMDIRRRTIVALWHIGVDDKAIPDPYQALEGPDEFLRIQAPAVLRIYRDRALALDTLVELLKDGDSRVRRNAVIALRFLGKRALRAEPEIKKLRWDSDAEVVRETWRTLDLLAKMAARKSP